MMQNTHILQNNHQDNPLKSYTLSNFQTYNAVLLTI